MRLTFAFFLSLIAIVSAASSSLSATCGKQKYDADVLAKAAEAACDHLKKKDTVGRQRYPHEYKNFENIKLQGSKPYYEFPVLSSGKVFSGGSPGADRVIITKDCKEAGVITHTGASGNNFVTCDVKTEKSAAPSVAVSVQFVLSLSFATVLYALLG